MEKTFWVKLKGWKKYTLGYIVLLMASHLVIWLFNQPLPPEQPTEQAVTVQVVKGDSISAERNIDIYYQDIYTGNKQEPPTLLLLPGGPEGPEVFDNLTTKLSDKYRLIIPHLPGYNNGKDHLHLPNYSFKTLAVYTNQLLEKLDLSNIHVLGYGLGGASAIYLSHDYPRKVASLSLVSSIGVQELELLGSYRLNHAVHGIQLTTVWVLHNAIPHFGLLNAIGINVSYARSHYQSDQRPLRAHLKAYKKPMLILHGKKDPLVPMVAAKEHHRIVPQSVLKRYNADHDLIETKADSVSLAIKEFVDDVENGRATIASNASEERIQEAQKKFSNMDFQKFKGVSLLIIMLIIVLATFVSEDLTCIGAGLLAARGLIGFWPATIACFIGIFLGDMGLYFVGRFMGRAAVRRAPFKWMISERDLDKSADWFKVRGPAIIIASRFLPGSRLPTYFSAGVIGAGFWMFSGYFLLAATIWTPMLVGISKLLGNELIRYFSLYHNYAIWVLLGTIFFLIMLVKVILPAFSYKGRRLLVSRYRRLTRWEYWSPFLLYAPVFCYVLYLGIKHRCLTLFTASNPALPDGGFVGESKVDILNQFCDTDVAAYQLINGDADFYEKERQAKLFMEENSLSFPVVLKPDVGERGRGVKVIRNDHAMQIYLDEAQGDKIIQEYIAGKEFGIFYYKIPGEQRGNIYSLTVKKLPKVTGNGQKTIEELILEDDRAVSMAKYHLRENEDHLYDVPEQGEEVTIVDLGTHARGAVFEEGSDLITDKLTEAMEQICKPVSGYYFGRFDIKAPSQEKLKNGEQLTVLEVNGVSSESTNIYDQRYSFWDAQQVLMKQWKLAFEIGKQNYLNGVDPTPTFTFLNRVFHAIKKG
ncbi:alpha/beta fold hydrolase [Fodinibius halophilus]|uniref:Alpha/beta fold hydrolase n=1 Tax=Fodinibius halophilus TaxID=1736908 RepID=A0A6M1SVL6_9BACT|nr:alpha/beta fold hydrolase [Fodinibius halophilus]NGP87978.1 alpha/beta fold hydrolase [Fodinibius halophilus]